MVRMEKRKSLVFFLDWQDVLRKYDRVLRCIVYDAICDYQESGEVPNFESYTGDLAKPLPPGYMEKIEMAFAFIKADVDRNNAKYAATCERRKRNIEKRWERERNSKDNNCIQLNNMNSNSSKNTENENENGKEKENVNGSENGKELSIINNIITTTTTKNIKKRNSEFGESNKEFLISAKLEDLKIAPADFVLKFRMRGADFEKNLEEFGGEENVSRLISDVIREWEANDKGEHDSLQQAFDHLESQMRIHNNIKLRKSKRNGTRRAKAEQRSDNKSGGRAPEASDFE